MGAPEGNSKVKKLFILLLLSMPALGALLLNLSCSATTPTAANNFQSPVQTIVAVNPSLTPTYTFTPTSTFTLTPTGTPTTTPTPFVATTWTGFNAPSGLAADGAGNVYVADAGNNKVEKYYPTGVLNPSWGLSVKGKVAVTNPVAVAVNSASTTVYVVGNSTNTLGVYTGDGDSVTQVTTANSIAFSGPEGVAVDKNGVVYVSDTGNQRIVELSSSGVYTASFSTTGSVRGIAVDGNLNVFGASGNTVQEYTSGSLALTIPGFSGPAGVAVDTGDNLYVADTGNKQVEEFASTGLVLPPVVVFNGSGLTSPKGVAVDPSGNIYVADSGANDVVKFTP